MIISFPLKYFLVYFIMFFQIPVVFFVENSILILKVVASGAAGVMECAITGCPATFEF